MKFVLALPTWLPSRPRNSQVLVMELSPAPPKLPVPAVTEKKLRKSQQPPGGAIGAQSSPRLHACQKWLITPTLYYRGALPFLLAFSKTEEAWVSFNQGSCSLWRERDWFSRRKPEATGQTDWCLQSRVAQGLFEKTEILRTRNCKTHLWEAVFTYPHCPLGYRIVELWRVPVKY